MLFLDEVGERPYRLHRMLTQLRLSGRLASASAIVFGQLPRCDEPGGAVTARAVVDDVLSRVSGTGAVRVSVGPHDPPLISLPLGVRARVVARGTPALVLEEAAAA